MTTRRWWLLMAIACAAGCAANPSEGWSTATVYPTDVSTVAIPIATNATYVRDVEFLLTDALIKEVVARTPYRIADQTRADTLLVVTIREVELDQLSKSPFTGLGEEVLQTVTIDFEWKNLRTDAVLLARERFTGSGLFSPSLPSGERIELGRYAAVQELARDVVSEMRGRW